MALDLAALALRIEMGGGPEAVRELANVDRVGQRAAVGATKSERSFKGLGLALSGMAARAAGVPGPVGAISRQLLFLGTGGLTFVAASAGIAALTLLFRKFTEEARKNAAAVKEAREAAQKLGQTAAGLAVIQAGTLSVERAKQLTLLAKAREQHAKGYAGWEQIIVDADNKIRQLDVEITRLLDVRNQAHENLAEAQFVELGILQHAVALAEQYVRMLQEGRKALRETKPGVTGPGMEPGMAPRQGLTGDITIKGLKLAHLELQNITSDLSVRIPEVRTEITEASQAIQSAIIDFGTGVADAFAGLIEGSYRNIGEFGQALAGAAGQVLKNLGRTLIGIGIAKSVLEKFAVLPGPAMIAAGAAIMALGAVLSRATAQAVSDVTGFQGGGGGGRGGGAGYTFQSLYTPSQPQRVDTRGQLIFAPTIIGPNDPAAQRAIADMVRKAWNRGI